MLGLDVFIYPFPPVCPFVADPSWQHILDKEFVMFGVFTLFKEGFEFLRDEFVWDIMQTSRTASGQLILVLKVG